MCKMFDAFEFENVSLYCKETLQYIPKFQITVKCKTQYDIQFLKELYSYT